MMQTLTFFRRPWAVLLLLTWSCAPARHDPLTAPTTPSAEALASWNETTTKARILDFLAAVTDETSPRYMAPEHRIATFDLDGTLIVERPDYLEVLVAVESLREDLERDPSLAQKQPWKAVSEDDADYWRQNADDVLLAAADGDRLDDYHRQVVHFLRSTDHPRWQEPYDRLFYRPMVELIELLRAREFQIYLVSASQQEYMRAFSQACLGVAPSQVIGSMVALELADPSRGFTRGDSWWTPMSDGEGKAERIHERIAASPIFAAGNSGGDQEMLELTAAREPSLVLLVHHDDGEREFDYSSEAILTGAQERQWTVVRMKDDWASVFGHHCEW